MFQSLVILFTELGDLWFEIFDVLSVYYVGESVAFPLKLSIRESIDISCPIPEIAFGLPIRPVPGTLSSRGFTLGALVFFMVLVKGSLRSA